MTEAWYALWDEDTFNQLYASKDATLVMDYARAVCKVNADFIEYFVVLRFDYVDGKMKGCSVVRRGSQILDAAVA